ncbi:CerR family C-terminal domain-containing protein [Vannielia litorea]|uniref:Transcriptional regulator, TetR family n=1 Tax=Vannielia litorea TaxID=1217970 RepID=A0A1N6HEJ2_9RHOB|nr:CerR family C-terminal domain-containing protein [Vannielia litorea]SIO18025.1 transcriptional regulator, TetR family [Vannielia litorea]
MDNTPTRDALLHAGLRLFGAQGYAAASTRAIAAQAGTNVASIAYHFGGKAGLHEACLDEVARRMGQLSEPPVAAAASPQTARDALEALLRRAVSFMFTADAAGEIVPFVLRVLTEGGAASEVLYDRLFLPRHRMLCHLWSVATGQPAESEATRLAVFSFIGQIVYFRINRAFVLRRMDWGAAGPSEAEAIADTLAEHLHAALERSRP